MYVRTYVLVGLAIRAEQRTLFVELMATDGCFGAVCQSIRTAYAGNVHAASDERLRFGSIRSRSGHNQVNVNSYY